MPQKELVRYEIIKKLIDGRINDTEVSKQLGLTVRQTKNIKAEVLKEGELGVIYKNRGRQSNRKIHNDCTIMFKNQYFQSDDLCQMI